MNKQEFDQQVREFLHRKSDAIRPIVKRVRQIEEEQMEVKAKIGELRAQLDRLALERMKTERIICGIKEDLEPEYMELTRQEPGREGGGHEA